MKRAGIFLFVAAVLICLFFYFLNGKKNEAVSSVIKPPSTSTPGFRLKKPIFLTYAAKGEALSEAEPGLVSSEDSSEAEISECWKKIESQTSANNFLSRHHESLKQVIGPWYFFKDNQERSSNRSSLPEKFLLALSKSGLLIALDREFEKNEDEALNLLKEVYTADPENSAPYLYAAIIYKKRGDTEMQQRLLNQIKNTKRFDSYLMDIAAQLFREVESTADVVEAYEALGNAPFPNHAALQRVLKDKELTALVANQMMSPALDNKAILSNVDWIPSEYSVGRLFAERADNSKTYPDDILERKFKIDNVEKVWRDLEQNCDLTVLNPLVDRLRTRSMQRRHQH